MKTAISIPNAIFKAVEEARVRLSMSRSELFTKAVQQFIEVHAASDVTERLNNIYSEHSSSLEAEYSKLQRRAVSGKSKRKW